MKKSSFMAMVIGIIGLTCFGLGLSMVLTTAVGPMPLGVVLGIAGLVLCGISVAKICKAENVQMPKVEGKMIKVILVGIAAVLLLGLGLTLAVKGISLIFGVILGVAGIIVGITILPMINGFTE